MQANIHPKYEAIDVKCSCGNAFVTCSTTDKKILHIEICSACHPFYTGKHKSIDTAGRIDKFNKKFAKHGNMGTKTIASESDKSSEPPAA